MKWLQRAAPVVALVLLGIPASPALIPFQAAAQSSLDTARQQAACTDTWRQQAEKNAAIGQRLASNVATYPVDLWRALMLGEDARIADGSGGGWLEDLQKERDFNQRLMSLGLPGPLEPRNSGANNYGLAVKLFDERTALLGKDHPYIRDWMLNQIDVFMAADTQQERPYLRRQYDGTVQKLAEDDLRYQLAAADFYGGKLDKAREAFDVISRDAASRYRLVARYMLARLPADAGKIDQAMAEIDSVDHDPVFAGIRIMDRQLLGVMSWNDKNTGVESRRLAIMAAAYLLQPGDALNADKALGDAYQQAFDDLGYILSDDRSAIADPQAFAAELNGMPMVGNVDPKQALDFLIWLKATSIVVPLGTGNWLSYLDLNLQNDSTLEDVGDIYAHIEGATGYAKLAWTITFAMRATPNSTHIEIVHQIREEIGHRLADCSATVAEQVAYGALRYHDFRLQLMSGDPTRLGELTVAKLQEGQAGSFGSGWRQNWAARYLIATGHADLIANVAKDLDDGNVRLIMSRSLSELAAALAYMGKQGYGGDDEFSATLLDLLPLSALRQLSVAEEIPLDIRKPLTRVAWMRAYLLQNQDALNVLTPAMAKTTPDLGPWLSAYQNGWTLAAKRQAILQMLLRTPLMTLQFSEQLRHTKDLESGAPLDPADGNYWCRFRPDEELAQIEQHFFDDVVLGSSLGRWSKVTDENIFLPDVLTDIDDARAGFLASSPMLNLIDHRELDSLNSYPTSTIYIGRQVLAWVRNRSWLTRTIYGDEDIAMSEALARVVHMTHHSCQRDEPIGVMSSRAYGLLHRLFPDSAAARNTPYWYDTGAIRY